MSRDTLQYIAASAGTGSKRKFTRAKSSTSLCAPAQPTKGGLNPSALFSVSAMATAPVGTTVIEDEEVVEDDVVVVMNELSSAAAKEDFLLPDEDEDLCEQCTRKRRARILQQQEMQLLRSDQSSSRQTEDTSSISVRSSKVQSSEEERALLAEDVDEAIEDKSNSRISNNCDDDTLPERIHQRKPSSKPKVPPPRPPRRGQSQRKRVTNGEESGSAVFTITPNPISNSENNDELKKLPDYCPAAEDASSMPTTPPEIVLLQKRIHLRRILPCIDFEGLERERMEMDETNLELVDSRLADAHRVVMQRTANRYLVMEAATFNDKLFTAILIIVTIMGILVLFWFRNFGPGILRHVVDTSDHHL